MNKIENTSGKSSFFTENKTKDIKEKSSNFIKKDFNDYKSRDMTQSDAKVSIPEAIKLFSQIKKAADSVPEQDNTNKINSLKAKIEKGQYEIDDNKLAENVARKEFQLWSE